MAENLNERLFARFGLEYPTNRIKTGFRSEVRKILRDNIGPILHPPNYQKEDFWWDVQSQILDSVCRGLFLDPDRFPGSAFSSGLNKWITEQLSDSVPFEEFLLRLQVLLDNLFESSEFKEEFVTIMRAIEKYLSDFPILSLTIKRYKKRGPQIYPSRGKQFDKKVRNTLDLLEVRPEYNEILEHYEQGLRELLSAKSKGQLKDSIEDMYTACDLTVALVFSSPKLGLRHLFQNGRTTQLGLNEWQVKVFDSMRDWMDKIKHGARKEYDFAEVEMIVLLASEFIRTLLNSARNLQK